MKARRSKWFFPAYVLTLGLVICGAEALGGHLVRGVESLAIMAVLALLVLLGGRSETVRGLRGDGRDERFALIDLRATAIAGSALIVAVLAAWLVELARPRAPWLPALVLAVSWTRATGPCCVEADEDTGGAAQTVVYHRPDLTSDERSCGGGRSEIQGDERPGAGLRRARRGERARAA